MNTWFRSRPRALILAVGKGLPTYFILKAHEVLEIKKMSYIELTLRVVGRESFPAVGKGLPTYFILKAHEVLEIKKK